ncbi:hypothetical protein H0H81_002145 [Sphagnurus paluster]|uniref:Uncharacterized protein n=1 Tax=Sphagnurus paluster TaxID=117069 RepID=A0A9P7GI75_9AGAR|nr:hypothetical protein H0H81_002145 [Sphagnurus paluster]
MICTRCTSSITATNRATNGHRFVFHSSEIIATERVYVSEEPGVIPYDPVAITLGPESSILPPFPFPTPSSSTEPRYLIDNAQYSRSSSPAPMSDYLPTPPLEFANPSLVSTSPDSFPFPREYTSPDSHAPHMTPFSRLPHSPFPPQYVYNHLLHRPTSAALSPSNISSLLPLSGASPSYESTAEQKEQPPQPRKLKSGDALFWHHLARNGEIPGVEDDKRARGNRPTSLAVGGEIIATLAFDR